MKKIRSLTIVKGSLGNAGPKAPLDVCRILDKLEQTEIFSLTCEKNLDYSVYLKALTYLKSIDLEDSVMILQYPFQPDCYHEKQRQFAGLLKELDPLRTWIWVHDINHIRFPNLCCYDEEMEWLKPFKYFIVHNSRMERYLGQYLNIQKCIHNEVFDYICRDAYISKCRQRPVNRMPEIVYAGNLVNSKSPFLYELSEEKMDFCMNIYGKREELIKNRKINYCGSFNADILPDKLRGDLGLIWDGSVDAHSDTLPQRNYTRYNTPHKFSCYMAAGMPVIAWKDSAISEVILKYQVGYLIENIYEISQLDFSQYDTYCKNAEKLAACVRNGRFTKRAIRAVRGYKSGETV